MPESPGPFQVKYHAWLDALRKLQKPDRPRDDEASARLETLTNMLAVDLSAMGIDPSPLRLWWAMRAGPGATPQHFAAARAVVQVGVDREVAGVVSPRDPGLEQRVLSALEALKARPDFHIGALREVLSQWISADEEGFVAIGNAGAFMAAIAVINATCERNGELSQELAAAIPEDPAGEILHTLLVLGLQLEQTQCALIARFLARYGPIQMPPLKEQMASSMQKLGFFTGMLGSYSGSLDLLKVMDSIRSASRAVEDHLILDAPFDWPAAPELVLMVRFEVAALDVRELVQILQAGRQRQQNATEQPSETQPSPVVAPPQKRGRGAPGPRCKLSRKHGIVLVDDEEVELTANQVKIIRYMIKNGRRCRCKDIEKGTGIGDVRGTIERMRERPPIAKVLHPPGKSGNFYRLY